MDEGVIIHTLETAEDYLCVIEAAETRTTYPL